MSLVIDDLPRKKKTVKIPKKTKITEPEIEIVKKMSPKPEKIETPPKPKKVKVVKVVQVQPEPEPEPESILLDDIPDLEPVSYISLTTPVSRENFCQPVNGRISLPSNRT